MVEIPIDAIVLDQMYRYAHSAKNIFKSEIAGWAHYNDKKGIYKLAPLLRQEAVGWEVDTFPEEILNDVHYDIHDMFVQWHSHVNFTCKPSATDKALIRKALEIMPMIISVIVNCKNEYTVNVSLKKAGLFSFSEIVEMEAKLMPYYNLDGTDKIVNKKLFKRPDPPKQESSQLVKYKGKWGIWNKGVFVPQQNISSSPQVFNDANVLNLFVPKDTMEEDYIEPIMYKDIMLFDDMVKILHTICKDYDDLSLWDHEEYIIIHSDKKSSYAEFSPNEIKINGTICEWEEALKRLGVNSLKYPLIKKDAKK